METVIFHVDVNSAFLSWSAVEALKRDPDSVDLRTIPSAVGGDKATRHGIITARSIPAKKYHVTTGEPVVKALEKCPNLVLVPGDYGAYSRHSHELMDHLRKYAPVVQQYSIDEAFCDFTGTKKLYGDPVSFAHKLKDEIYETYGFSVNVGISSNKLLAKMASDFEKPNRVHTLYPEEVPGKMWPLPVGDLFSVGKSTAARLHALGIHTIGELAHTDESILVAQFKSFGHVLYEYANGRSSSDFAARDKDTKNKSYSNEITISHDVTNTEEAHLILLSLAESVGSRLRRDGFKVSVVQAYYKDAGFAVHSKQLTLDAPTDSTQKLYETGVELFDLLWQEEPIRLMGLSGARAESGELEQLNFFDMEKSEKRKKLDTAIDEVRNRFGAEAITRASLLDQTDRKRLSRK